MGHGVSGHAWRDDTQKQRVREALLSWYDVEKRILPWRWPHHHKSTRVPEGYAPSAQRAYEVWVSEIMLQQTQVATVIDYYNTWMEKWPSIFDLAAAELDEVNKVWAGLGYYGRAKRLHEGAKQIVANSNGMLPVTAKALADEVPGVGPYTAGAISSIAYNQRAGIVDGNVIRVLSRLKRIAGDIKEKKTTALFWQLAEEIVDPDRPGDFNQALMDFGSLNCAPKHPSCFQCVLKTHCEASSTPLDDTGPECTICIPGVEEASTLVTDFPVKVVRKESRKEHVAVCILEGQWQQDGQAHRAFLLLQRPAKGLLAGLFEFPSAIMEETVSVSEQVVHVDAEKNNHVDAEKNKSDEIVPSQEMSLEKRRQYITALLEKDERLAHLLPLPPGRDLGSLVHLFSHIHCTYWGEHVILPLDSPPEPLSEEGSRVAKWVSEADLAAEAIPTGLKKMLQRVILSEAEKKKAAKKKRKEETSTQKISAFFTKKVKT